MGLNIGICLFFDVEALDFADPYEEFTTGCRVFTPSATGGLVRYWAGLRINYDFTSDRHLAIDVPVIPGGVVTKERKSPTTNSLDWRSTRRCTTDGIGGRRCRPAGRKNRDDVLGGLCRTARNVPRPGCCRLTVLDRLGMDCHFRRHEPASGHASGRPLARPGHRPQHDSSSIPKPGPVATRSFTRSIR